jgi:hypothetical protein
MRRRHCPLPPLVPSPSPAWRYIRLGSSSAPPGPHCPRCAVSARVLLRCRLLAVMRTGILDDTAHRQEADEGQADRRREAAAVGGGSQTVRWLQHVRFARPAGVPGPIRDAAAQRIRRIGSHCHRPTRVRAGDRVVQGVIVTRTVLPPLGMSLPIPSVSRTGSGDDSCVARYLQVFVRDGLNLASRIETNIGRDVDHDTAAIGDFLLPTRLRDAFH